MFEEIHVRRPIEIWLFYLHARVPVHEVGNVLTDQRTADMGVCLRPITWSILCSDNMQLLKLALDHKHKAVPCSLSPKNLFFSQAKLQHLRKYELILKSTWVKMKLVFHNAAIASKYCLVEQDLLKTGCSYKSHTSYSTSDWSGHKEWW